MTTQEFIEKHLNTTDGKTRHCSSVFTDGNGNFYSYGYHYPLIVKIGNQFFINDAGYSVTTARHILWAHGALPLANVYNHKYQDDKRVGYTTQNISRSAILSAITNELEEARKTLPKLRKNAFRKKATLEKRIIKLERSLSNL